ncbi:hypothetical protein [Pseudoalteromonas sp. bablab_jr010]|uniref:hypothetical protein n=1 Tax=Pseudoalteromonas sp. bablab_jr010 TaxID=2755063 RepID=UPI0018F7ACE0|nr:hypothetical protein [Pseudoalteromonas sp. bablab_jr010]
MNEGRSQFYFLQMVFLFVGALLICFFSPVQVDLELVGLAFVFIFLALVYFFYIRKRAGLSKHSFSLTMIFIFSYFIVFFQFPLDLLLSSFSDNSLYNSLVYDESVLVESIWYLVCFFILLCLGMHRQVNRMLRFEGGGRNYKRVITKPFFYLFYLLFFMHLLTVDVGYYAGGRKGELTGLAGSILGYFVLLLPVCFGVVIYNSKVTESLGKVTVVDYVKLFPLPFTIILVLFSFITFLAGDRGPAIRTLILLVFSYYIISNTKVSNVKFIFIIIFAGFFLSVIKFIGAINYNEDLIGSFLSAIERLNDSSKVESISPFTAELSASFRAYNTSFSLWSSGYSLYGASVITGFLMSIPYGVSSFMQVFELSNEDINSAYTITTHVGEVYGLGTTVVGDSLLNVGFIPTLIMAYFMGRLFIKIDYTFFIKRNSVYIYTLGLYFLMNAVNLARGSIFPAIGNVIFISCLVFLIVSLFQKNKLVLSGAA